MMIRMLSTAVLAAMISSSALAKASEKRNSILSCKFKVECPTEYHDCEEIETWDIVRYYPGQNRFTVFDALNSHENEATYEQVGELRIWNMEDTEEAPSNLSGVDRLVVAPDMSAAMQGTFWIEVEPNDMKFFSYSNSGACTEISK